MLASLQELHVELFEAESLEETRIPQNIKMWVAITATSAGRKQTGKATTAAVAGGESGPRVRDNSYKDCESMARTDSNDATVRRSTAVGAPQ